MDMPRESSGNQVLLPSYVDQRGEKKPHPLSVD